LNSRPPAYETSALTS